MPEAAKEKGNGREEKGRRVNKDSAAAAALNRCSESGSKEIIISSSHIENNNKTTRQKFHFKKGRQISGLVDNENFSLLVQQVNMYLLDNGEKT